MCGVAQFQSYLFILAFHLFLLSSKTDEQLFTRSSGVV